MRKTKKILSLMLSIIMLMSTFSTNFAVNAQEANETKVSDDTSPFKVEITTNKDSYRTLGIADISVKVTNTSEETINNVSAEAIFENLTPLGKGSTANSTETLNSGESIEFSYRVTLNPKYDGLNFLQGLLLRFKKLFYKKVYFSNYEFSDGGDCVEETKSIMFGKFNVENKVRVWYNTNYTIITDLQFEQADEATSELKKIVKPYADIFGYVKKDDKKEIIKKLSQKLEEYKIKGIVKEYATDGEHSITVTFDGNITYIYPLKSERTLNGSGNSKIITMQSDNFWGKTLTGRKRLEAQLDSWVNDFGFGIELKDNAEFITNENNKFIYDNEIKSSKFTIEKIMNLSTYDILIIEGHGVWHETMEFCAINTGEKINKDSDKKYSEEIASKEIVRCPLDWQKDTYAVSPTFLSKHLKYSENSLVFLGNCDSLKNDKLAQTFKDKGAYAVVGYNDKVDISYEILTRSYFFRYITQKDENGNYLTINNAVNKVKRLFANYLEDCDGPGEISVSFNEKLDGSSKTIFENTKACNETSHDSNKNNLAANDSDFEELCTLLENFSMFGTPFEFSSSDSSAYQTLLGNLLENCTATTLYTYIYGKEAEYVNASEGLFKNSPKTQRDPLDKFGEFGCYGKVNADEIDWIIKNVFGVTPDRNNATISRGGRCYTYYYDNCYYFACVGSEYEFGNHIIKNKSVTSDNVYTIEIDVNVISYDEISTYYGAYEVVCALKDIDGKRQWTFSSIEKIEKEESNTQSTTASTSSKETTTKKTNKSVTVEEITKNKEWYSDDGKLLATIGHIYPKITIADNKSASKKINNYILDSDINKCFTEEYRNELKKSYKNLLSEGYWSWSDGDPEIVRNTVKVEYYNNKYISISWYYSVKVFTGVSLMSSVNGLVFDINTGELLSFSDMFNSQNKFIDIINSYLNKNHSETMNNSFKFTGDSDYTGRPNWLLSEEGLVVYNNDFGTSQVPQYKIPYSLVEPYLKDKYSE